MSDETREGAEELKKIIYNSLTKASIDVLKVVRDGILEEAEGLNNLDEVSGMKRAADYIEFQIQGLSLQLKEMKNY